MLSYRDRSIVRREIVVNEDQVRVVLVVSLV